MSLETGDETGSGTIAGYPTDLAFVSVAALAGYLLVTSLSSGDPLRFVSSLPVLFVLPGYALVSLLFPASERPARQDAPVERRPRPGGIDGVERLGLSLGLSLATLPPLVIGLPLTQWGLTVTSAAASLTIVTVVAAQLAVVRRLRLPQGERYRATPRRVINRLVAPTTDSRAVVSSFLLIVAMLAAVGVLVAAVTVPLGSASYTELGLYEEDEEGSLVTADYPSTVAPGESIPVIVGVENQEGEEMTYTVVIQQQIHENDEVQNRTELDRIDYRVGDGGTAYGERAVAPTVEDRTVKITALLYETTDDETVPTVPTSDTADEEVYFWTNATDTPEESPANESDDGADTDGPPDDTPAADDDDGPPDDTPVADDDDDGFFPFDVGLFVHH